MIKKIIYSIIFMSFLMSAGEPTIDFFSQKKVYTIINNTQDPLDGDWQTGSGDSNVQTGRKGSFHLSPNTSTTNRYQIVASGTDCIDWIIIKSASSGATVKGSGICKDTITIEYQGDLKNQKLVLKVS